MVSVHLGFDCSGNSQPYGNRVVDYRVYQRRCNALMLAGSGIAQDNVGGWE